jgi:O-antigen biosynthesis protein
MSHHKPKSIPTWTPIAVRGIELSRPLVAIEDVQAFAIVRLFLFWRDIPVAWVDFANQYQTISVARLEPIIAAQSWEKPIEADRFCDDIPVSIVIATCDRPEALTQCLTAVLAQKTTRSVQILVIDNRPDSGQTKPVIDRFEKGFESSFEIPKPFTLTYIAESRPGGSFARNAGFRAATGEIVMTVDDDVTLPPDWLERILAPFNEPSVSVVTGNLLPGELDTRSQQIFENYGNGGLGRGFKSFEVDRAWFDRQRLAVPTWELGATANAAFRSEIFRDRRVGLMDEVLGPGMPSGAGEDLYFFYRILKAGYHLRYEPLAWGWHQHRRTMAELQRQLFNYGKGNIAYHSHALIYDRDFRVLAMVFIFLPIYYSKQVLIAIFIDRRYPLSLRLAEIAGLFAGPWGYWRSVRLIKRIGRGDRLS